jgi:hypothetical protein
MNHALLVENLRPLPRAGRVRLGAQLERLQRICGNETPLEPFLEELLDVLGRIFGAAAGAFWFRPWGAAGLCPSIRVGFSELPLSQRGLSAVDHSVASLWQSPEPSVQVHSDHASTVLVGPIRDGEESIGAVQLVIIDNQWDRSPDLTLETGLVHYSQALDGIMAIIQPALLRRMRVRTISLRQADAGLNQLGQQIAGIQRSIRVAIERHLQQLSGASFGTLADNQEFVRSVQKMLDAHGLRVRCPECGHPAILRCSKNATVPSGVFVFDHYLPEGRTFHGGGRTLPMVRIVAKPLRRQATPATPDP